MIYFRKDCSMLAWITFLFLDWKAYSIYNYYFNIFTLYTFIYSLHVSSFKNISLNLE